MKEGKTRVGKILSGILRFVSSIFTNSIKGAEKDFHNLTKEEQELLKSSVGIMNFITREVGKTGDVIRLSILTTFPNVSLVSLEASVYGLAHLFNIDTSDNNLDDTIIKLQEHLNDLHGKIWDTALDSAANVVSFLLSRPESKLEAGFGLIKYVYLTFFKKKA